MGPLGGGVSITNCLYLSIYLLILSRSVLVITGVDFEIKIGLAQLEGGSPNNDGFGQKIAQTPHLINNDRPLVRAATIQLPDDICLTIRYVSRYTCWPEEEL